MFKILIAEDSKPILRNIRSHLESAELPITVAAAVSNGEEALTWLGQNPVDILLTDIRMPKLDGMALIEQARKLYPQLKVVLISSYSDFEYTRKALNLQVFDYLLKPVEKQTLIEVIERVIDQLKERRTDKLDYFRGVVSHEFLSHIQLDEAFYQQESKFMLLLRQQPFTPVNTDANAGTIQNLISLTCSPHPCRVFPLEKEDRFLVLTETFVIETYKNACDWMEAVSKTLREHHMPMSMASSFQPVELSGLNVHYDKLEQALHEELRVAMPVFIDLQRRYAPHREHENERMLAQFSDMIEQRHKEQFLLKLSEQLQRWQLDTVRVSTLDDLLQMIAETFVKASQASESPEWEALADEAGRMLELDSYESFCQALLEWSEYGFDLVIAQNRKSADELFQQIDSYLKLNKYSQLSISDIAAKFHVSPSYVSRIMKRCTNQTFVHYYMKLKIDEACMLLQTKPDMLIKEISDALAFSDQHYFSKVFKEYAGCSPSEYREN
ncbi:response regulator [Paenibacillus sp. HB172176]|uniref:response regulator n=1 Tax=Paenibacillus sp. HB172176 TaxID=2493690 RepID=UPI00143B1FDF|nr:response regulator [Paenibacillus sp. HB172176]